MTKEELQKANTNEILEELYYCGRDPYYADYYENVTTEIKNRLEKIADLEKQIEKMKCCYNCRYSRKTYEHCKTDKHEKWELKE